MSMWSEETPGKLCVEISTHSGGIEPRAHVWHIFVAAAITTVLRLYLIFNDCYSLIFVPTIVILVRHAGGSFMVYDIRHVTCDAMT